jgi:DNA-binding NarL/FixJ family response regulator
VDSTTGVQSLVPERLFISEATVKTYLLHLFARLGVNDPAAAVAAAYEQGLLTPGDVET